VNKADQKQITETMQNVLLQPVSCEMLESVTTGGRWCCITGGLQEQTGQIHGQHRVGQ